MMHFDFNQPDAHSYEQALQTMRRLEMPMRDVEQQFRRAVLNVLARNHDDHVKNIAYLMDKRGTWSLSPAFDVAYAYNPDGVWTNRHQMSVNGKRDGFGREDLVALGSVGGLKRARAEAFIDEVDSAVGLWRSFAERAGIDAETTRRIERAHRRFSS